jgi:hypothetical protein
MFELGKLLSARDIQFDHVDRQIMCFPHVINICCTHVISSFTDVDLVDALDELEALVPHTSDRQSLEDAVARDPIALGRTIVRILRASGQRRDDFDELIRDGNEKGWFRVGNPAQVVQLAEQQLLHDVRTRWDSIYFMIRRLRDMRPVCYTYLCQCEAC